MPNYNNGKIYKIIDSENKVIYIGSTVEKLCRRYSTHQHKAIGNKIILIENCPCNSREELVKKEQEIIEQYDNLLNKFRAYRSEEDNTEDMKISRKKYYENNKDEILEKAKVYRENNKEKISENHKVYYEKNKEYHKEYRKVYNENNKEKISENKKVYYENNKEKISENKKVYNENNKDKILEKAKVYREKNKDKILEKAKVKVLCVCGCEIRKSNITTHIKTKKHIDLMNTIKV